MITIPLLDELAPSRSLLIAGAGGGFDVFGGLPLYFALQQEGRAVHLANLSFSSLPAPDVTGEERLSPALVKVTADIPVLTGYFPERHLSAWFREQGREVPVYCFERTGVRPLRAAYQALVDQLSIDTVLLIDGGMDSLMRGDESGLGTPHEDIASIAAVAGLPVERTLLACLAFGVDAYHGVCHAHALEAVADLTRRGAYLGAFSVTDEMSEVRLFRQATEWVFRQMPGRVSIVASSVLSALAGQYGDYHTTKRTAGSMLWINPLMPVYWSFRLPAVAERNLYLDAVLNTETRSDIDRVLREFVSRLGAIRGPERIPV